MCEQSTSKKEIYYIGLTGLPGSGKSEFIKILKKILNDKDIICTYYSLSDELREEARKMGLTIKRDVLHNLGNELRSRHGNGILSLKLCKKISKEIIRVVNADRVAIVIDGIRNPEEVLVFRKEFGHSFSLIAIKAPIDEVLRRLSSRSRQDENTKILKHKNLALKMVIRESGEGEPSHGINIHECMTMAEYAIDNSKNREHLSQMVEELCESLIT